MTLQNNYDAVAKSLKLYGYNLKGSYWSSNEYSYSGATVPVKDSDTWDAIYVNIGPNYGFHIGHNYRANINFSDSEGWINAQIKSLPTIKF